MAKKKIDLNPQILDLTLYAGDGVSFRITAIDITSEPVDLSGEFKAQIRASREAEDPPMAEFSFDLSDAETGIILFSLTGEQTHALITTEKFVGVWDLQWIPTGQEPVTLLQGKVECDPDVTH